MSDDVILSRAEAKNLADFLRRRGIGEHHSLLKRLDPPQPSLHDEVELCLRDTVSQWQGEDFFPQTDAVLAVVRKHAENLLSWESPSGDVVVSRRDLLDLMGATDD